MAATPATQESSPKQNLLAAMRLWGDIKFFDPALTSGGTDWDAAFLQAEPAIAAATNATEYATAVQTMLAPLHDPTTCVTNSASAPSAGQRVRATLLANATLVTIPHGVTSDETVLDADLASALAAATKTQVVAVDLRGLTQCSDGDVQALQDLFTDETLLPALVSGSFALPRERSRAYTGYPTQDAGSAGPSYAGRDVISDAVTFVGTSKTKHRFVFLADANTSLPSIAFGLAASGQAAIYAVGGNPSTLADAQEMNLAYGVRAQFRTADLAGFSKPALPAATDPADAVGKSMASPALLPSTSPGPSAGALPTDDDPYAADTFPDEPKRMLAIARIYNVIRYFSPYTNLMHDDWDAAALRAISDEAAARDTRSYLLGLMRFYAHLHDSHGALLGKLMLSQFGAGVPFQVRYLHGKVVVTNVNGGLPDVSTLHVGDIIDTVNGAQVRRAMDDAEEYISSSTPQAADATALLSSNGYSIFTGRKGTPVSISFHRESGFRGALTVTRDFYVGATRAHTAMPYFVMPGNVGYVDFDRLDPSETDAMFEALKGTRAIVFDNRGYPKPSVWSVVPRLTNSHSVRAALFDTPFVSRPLDVLNDDAQPLPGFTQMYNLVPESNEWKYLKPTVMLIDDRAISLSEHSALFFRAAAHTRFVGTPTDGANGDGTAMVVPGGVYLGFSGQGVRWPNGDQLQRVGIQPDVRIAPNAADIAIASDIVLQKGLNEALRLAGVGNAERSNAIKGEIARESAAFDSKPFDLKGSNAQPLTLAWRIDSASYHGWTTPGSGYAKSNELSLERVAGAAVSTGQYSGALDITAYRGKTVRVRGYLSSEAVDGAAGFWLSIDGPSPRFDSTKARWVTGTSDWKPFAIILYVPTSATQAVACFQLSGTGVAHASALTIDIVPGTTTATDP
jgi:C-terminal processing protease CtpA/Prc